MASCVLLHYVFHIVRLKGLFELAARYEVLYLSGNLIFVIQITLVIDPEKLSNSPCE